MRLPSSYLVVLWLAPVIRGAMRNTRLGLPPPDLHHGWQSVSASMDFQPANSSSLSRPERFLAASSYASSFVNGAETYYDPYATAWRLLGLYTDCSSAATSSSNGRQRRQQQRRRGAQNQNQNAAGCIRYLLWGAYVDLEYQGGGTGEYQFYDSETEEWDSSACKLHGTSRCAKMDCHLHDTHFKLLGFFKQYDYDTWLEQLIYHEGYCLWSSSQFSFMDQHLQWWPQGCQQAPLDNNDGSSLYYSVKPLSGGKMGIGLYTDQLCSVEYKDSTYSVADIINSVSNLNDGIDVNSAISAWNRDLSYFHVCQPCMSYSRTSVHSDDDDDTNVNGGYFRCQDYSGNVHSNQCTLFKSATDPQVASYADLALAHTQDTIARSYTSELAPSYWQEWGMFTLAAALFACSVLLFGWAARPSRLNSVASASEPLMEE